MLATQGYWEPSEEDEESLGDLQRRLGLSRERGSTVPHPDPHEGEGVTKLDNPLESHSPTPTVNGHAPLPSAHEPLESRRDISIVQPPPQSTPLLPVSTLAPTVLPIELVQTLNSTFFLHLLATDPERVLPPGKSLLSMMSAPRTNSQSQGGSLPELEDRVKDVIYGAFWKEVPVFPFPSHV